MILTSFLATPFTAVLGSSVNVSLQSPFVQETEGGTIVTVAFVISNYSDETETLLPTLSLPKGWTLIPFEEPFLSLQPKSSSLQLFAIRVPTYALAGTYPLLLTLQGREHPSLLTKTLFQIRVLPKSGFTATLEERSLFVQEGEPFDLRIQIHNQGNREESFVVEAPGWESSSLTLSPPSLLLPPGGLGLVTLTASFPLEGQESLKRFLPVIIRGKDKTEQLFAEIEIFPRAPPSSSHYRTLPMQTVLGCGTKNEKKQLFLEQSGKGSVGPGQLLDFFVRAPVLSEVNVDRDLGGPPENGYLHYQTKRLDAYGGDGVYDLTPLTLLGRFGRGGSLSLLTLPLSLKGLYVQDTSSTPLSLFGQQISYKPCSFLSFSSASIQTRGSPSTYSFLGTAADKTRGNATLEYASSKTPFSSFRQRGGYYLYANTSSKAGTWCALQSLYAGKEFIGYYEDTRQLYASLGFPLIRQLRGTLSYNLVDYNLAPLSSTQNAPRNKNGYAGLSYSFPSGLYLSSFYNLLSSKDAKTQFGYQTQFASLNGGKSFGKWTIQSLLEYGRYTERLEATRAWQTYQLYSYYHPSARSQYALYTRVGYTELSEQIEWARIYGLSTSQSLAKRLYIQGLYEYSDQKNRRSYCSLSVKYTFHNSSFLELKGYWNQDRLSCSTVEWLLSYTIPWHLPIGKDRSKGRVEGRILPSDIPPLLVHCAGKRTLTDKEGRFSFSSLEPGSYYLWTEKAPEGKVSLVNQPLLTKVEGGERTRVDLPFEAPATLRGSLLFQSTKEGLKNTPFSLFSPQLQKTLSLKTDALGQFQVKDLPPGRWILALPTDSLPPYHRFEEEELILDLFPGQVKELTCSIYSKERTLQLIDTDTVR